MCDSWNNSGLITGSNLQGIHQRYQAVLDIMVGKQCSLTEAMRQFGIPRNTLRDYITICKLHIIDREKYKREGWSRQNSKDWERSPRNLLSCAIGWFLMNTEFNQIDEKKGSCFLFTQMNDLSPRGEYPLLSTVLDFSQNIMYS